MIIDRKYSDWKGTNISQVSSRFVNQRTRSRVVRKVVRTGNGRCTAVRIDIHKESSHSSPDRGDCSLAENKSSRSRLRTTIDQLDFSFGIVPISSRFSPRDEKRAKNVLFNARQRPVSAWSAAPSVCNRRLDSMRNDRHFYRGRSKPLPFQATFPTDDRFLLFFFPPATKFLAREIYRILIFTFPSNELKKFLEIRLYISLV